MAGGKKKAPSWDSKRKQVCSAMKDLNAALAALYKVVELKSGDPSTIKSTKPRKGKKTSTD